MRSIPLILTALRAVLAPVLVLLALFWPVPVAFGVCLLVGFLSDAFDGIIARRLGVVTPNLRRLDSIADTLFYLAATYAVWHLGPHAILNRLPALAILAVLEISRYLLDFAKFRREASYHTWFSKLWGILLFAAFSALLVFGKNDLLVDLAVYIGIVADLEGIIISLILPHWQSDVPTLVHALRLRTAAQI